MSPRLIPALVPVLAAGAFIATVQSASAINPQSFKNCLTISAKAGPTKPGTTWSGRPGTGLGADIRCYQRVLYQCLKSREMRKFSPHWRMALCRQRAINGCEELRER